MSDEWKSRVEALPGATPLIDVRGQWWMDAPQIDVQALARLMQEAEIRLSTMTGIAAAHGETQVIYHYAVAGGLLNVKACTRQNEIASITPITRAAAWIEREISDLYGVTFTGHPNPTRLLRPPQLAAGFFREDGQ